VSVCPSIVYAWGAELTSQIVPEIFLEGKWGATVGAVPQWRPLVRGLAEADDDLLIQQQHFCTHSYFYTEIQL